VYPALTGPAFRSLIHLRQHCLHQRGFQARPGMGKRLNHRPCSRKDTALTTENDVLGVPIIGSPGPWAPRRAVRTSRTISPEASQLRRPC